MRGLALFIGALLQTLVEQGILLSACGESLSPGWLRGRAVLALGQYDVAQAAFLRAREAAEAQEERVVLWQILFASAEVEDACSDMAAADRLRDKAREVVRYIAEHAGELRVTFENQTAVARLLGKV